jgi:superfamily II DNA or RNA helicase
VLAAHGSAAALRGAAAARIELLPHQLEPALAFTMGLGSRALLADDVGLGKTIEAGLVIAELMARGAAERVLILVPAGLREQWAAELTDRFAVDAVVLDTHDAARRAAQLPIGLNPWSTVPVVVTSLDYVKRPDVLRAARSCRWDVVVVDEAHALAPDTDRHRAAGALAEGAPYVLLLTATPHNGDRRAFALLCGLGSVAGDPPLIFRRTRRDVALGHSRHVHRLFVRPDARELSMYGALARLVEAVRAEDVRDPEAWLGLAVLHKRGFSCAHSLHLTSLRRLDRSAGGEPAERQLGLQLADDDGESAPDDAPSVEVALLANEGEERKLLEAIAGAARRARANETKLATLRRLLRRLNRLGEAAIVFTEYRDTLLHAADLIGRDCAIVHGGLTREERRLALGAFTSGRASLLLTTDAASEGLNLHHTCRVVINLELPWNPTRLEQRIGRVDRIGQPRRVHAFHLVAAGVGELQVLERLEERIARARAEFGAADPLGTAAEGAESPAVTMPFTSLSLDAVREHARLTAIRSRGGTHGCHAPASAVETRLAAHSRRRGLRTRLGARVLALVQSSILDGFDRTVALHLTPILLPRPTRDRRCDAGRLAELVTVVEAMPLDGVDASLVRWRDDSLRQHRAFWTERLGRERAIVGAGTPEVGALFQAGLFDRRAVLEHEAAARQRSRQLEEAAIRVAAIELSLTCTPAPPRAALILVPLVG